MAPNPSPSTSTAAMCSSSQPRNLRSGQEERIVGVRKHPPERSASFHGRTAAAFPQQQRQIRRPKTQPNLLPRGARSGGAAAAAGTSPDGVERKVPTKVLVNVTVQRSLGPVQVMASTDWSVGDLVAAALRLYVKEGRRPPLPTAEPSAFGFHYSQFSLESLDPKEKLVDLGSRNFFLCLNPQTEAAASASSSSSGSCSKQAEKASKIGISWLSFMDCLL
ncbi:hypothetical protein MUK42_14646 [Musa troglodytarum]|uniref:DUF7054 domain-containing protein n=1 Tax=Musa troglodytarum TaxID=320322 RepID=A0A9E7I6S5_9LILI|nr:hypothetical protein MUK42_14646 [Musa troglodytarum]URE47276.1 hypothetical protein MUK42_14646 [Musa troglodytarum]